MSIEELKGRLRDVPGIENLTMKSIVGRQNFEFNGLIASVDPHADDQEIETAIRHTAELAKFGRGKLPAVDLVPTKSQEATMSAPSPGSFAASIRAMMDEARAGVAQARADGLAKVGEAVGKLNEAKTATASLAGTMAKTIEDEAAMVMSELGQLSNFPPEGE